MDEDYAYLQPRFFETTQELQNLILNDSEAKWLIFVRAKEMASELMQKLNLPEGDITYYDADTDKELEQYKRLIENEELAHRVTISTTLLYISRSDPSERCALSKQVNSNKSVVKAGRTQEINCSLDTFAKFSDFGLQEGTAYMM